jgi:hypothetical protein
MSHHTPTTHSAPENAAPDGHDDDQGGRLMFMLRYVLPSVVTIAGLVMMALGGEINVEGGAGIVSAGLAIFLINWLLRAGASGDREREREDAAREYFDVHGRWPD